MPWNKLPRVVVELLSLEGDKKMCRHDTLGHGLVVIDSVGLVISEVFSDLNDPVILHSNPFQADLFTLLSTIQSLPPLKLKPMAL